MCICIHLLPCAIIFMSYLCVCIHIKFVALGVFIYIWNMLSYVFFFTPSNSTQIQPNKKILSLLIGPGPNSSYYVFVFWFHIRCLKCTLELRLNPDRTLQGPLGGSAPNKIFSILRARKPRSMINDEALTLINHNPMVHFIMLWLNRRGLILFFFIWVGLISDGI